MAQIVVQDITAAGGIITYQNATEGGGSFSNAGTDPDGEDGDHNERGGDVVPTTQRKKKNRGHKSKKKKKVQVKE